MADRTFNNFKEASEFAKNLAEKHEVTIALGRRANSFYVEIPEGLAIVDDDEEPEYEEEYLPEEYNYQDDYDYQETQREIREEVWDYAESMARSEEEGWFHPDREGSWEDNLSNEKD